MLMHRDLQNEDTIEDLAVMVSPALHMEKFSPLSERLSNNQHELLDGMKKLEQLMGKVDFGKYVETLIAIHRQAESLIVITDRELHRSLLERSFKPQIKQAFGVSHLQIVSQA